MLLRVNRFNSGRMLGFSLCLSALLSGCDHSQLDLAVDAEQINQAVHTAQIPADVDSSESSGLESEERGKKLTDIAGQATIPVLENQSANPSNSSQISEQQLKYVGRYHVQINCSDDFVRCEKGNAEYILNLLPDGMAHQTIIYSGRVYSDALNHANMIQSYRKDTWSYHNNEIIVHLDDGAAFYYSIDPQQNLVMNVDKILKANNKNNRFFKQQYPALGKTYILTKSPNS